MKLHSILPRKPASRGYATLAVVASLSLVLISMMTYSLLGNMNSFDAQVQAQLKQDYSQKEDAILTALLHIVPNKAIGAMKQGSASTPDDYSWESIFSEALTVANAEQAADTEILTSLNLTDAISANTGDTTFDEVIELVSAPVHSPSNNSSNMVNGGNWWEYYMLFDGGFYPYIPAPLMLSHSHYLLDKEYPIISFDKLHVYNYRAYNHIYFKGLRANTDKYPLYNQLEYPDVKFGYRRPGQLFVGKRNWWTFSLTFGKGDQARSGAPPVTKNYVISIYEIPSQLPLSASSLMQVGKFADGTNWENVTLQGGIYADAVETQGSVALGGGAISARKSLTLGGTTTVEGRTVRSNFDELGQREARALESQSDFYDASLAGNVGKVSFIPLNPGADFLRRASDGPASERISPTGWNHYTRGANQTAMRLEVKEMVAEETQIPLEVEFSYIDTDGATQTVSYRRGVNWPTDVQPGGDVFPFQTDVLENLRNALVINLDRFPAFLASIADAEDTSVNHSLHITPQHWQPTVVLPSIPSLETDLAVTLRGGKDLTEFERGFSVVTDLRLYVAETLNAVATTPPSGSGLPSSTEYYPPLSLFAPEKRFGESLTIDHPLNLRGQISSLKTSTGDTFNPLELKDANDERVEANKLNADLVSIQSPAELPPIHLMNWMITIEPIR